MGPHIIVRDLRKVYRVPEREPGLGAALRSIFHRRFSNVFAVDGVSFTVQSGETVGFIGPNGAGKTPRSRCSRACCIPRMVPRGSMAACRGNAEPISCGASAWLRATATN